MVVCVCVCEGVSVSVCTHAQGCSYTCVERTEVEVESLPLTFYALSFEAGFLIESRAH